MTQSQEILINFNLSDSEKKVFLSIEEFQKWVQKERQSWEWLQKFSRSDHQIVVQIMEKVNSLFDPIENAIRDIINTKEQNQRLVRIQQIPSLIESRVKQLPFVFFDSPEGKFIESLRQDKPVIAGHMAGFMMGVQLNSSSRESLEGAFLAIAYRNGFQDKSKSEKESLQSLHAEWNNLMIESKVAFEVTVKEHKEFGEFKLLSENEFKAIIEKSDKELKNIEKTYDEKLAVQAAVVYWKKKADSHAKASKILSWASAIVGVFVAGLIGVETFLAIGPLQKLGDLPIWKGTMLILTAVIGVWAIRILVRLLLSNLHLKAEAVERRTMLLTYLALLRRGQGPNEKQRELILHILFRPSSTGIIRDDALPPIVAQWLNTVTTT